MSKNFIMGGVVTFVFACVLLVSTSSAKAAEYPNILVDQDMSIGSTGQGVVVLQGLLSESGYLTVPAGVPFGYFGSLTKSALGRYQASLNVSPSVGYFGPATKIAMHNDFSPRGWLGILGW